MSLKGNEFQPAVSIVIPVRNGEATIGTLLESLLNLDYDKEKVEVVVVDGNSTDRTRDVVSRYPVKLFIEGKEGLNTARNAGIRNSSGEIIAFTDSDCIAPKNWVRKIVENFKDPRVGCVGGNTKGCDSDFLSQYADNSIIPVLRSFKRREALNMIKLFVRYPAGCNMAFKRRAIEEVGGFDESIRHSFDEDELIERVCRTGYKMVLDPNVLIQHKHRSTLNELLKQTFRYGRGGGFLLKRKRAKDVLSKWFLLTLLGFIAWLSLIGLLTLLTLTTGLNIFSVLLFGTILIPLLTPMALYTHRALKNRRYERVIAYPPIDLLRMLVFCAGEAYQLFKHEKLHE